MIDYKLSIPIYITDNPINVFYLYNHLRRHAHTWPRLFIPKEEVASFLHQLPSSEGSKCIL